MALAPRLAAEDLWLGYGGRSAVQEVSVAVQPGEVVSLIGPNGSGKSTLLKGLARLLLPLRGAVLLDGRAIQTLPGREVARRLAILPQDPESPADLTVGELVALGRWPHLRGWLACDAGQDPAVAHALALTALTAFAHRPLATLSGGERQRAWIAMALAQTPTVLLLDEPTTHVDLGNQWEVMDLLERLNRQHGVTIVMALHDLQQAAWLAHRLVVLKGGCLITQGPPRDVLTPELISDAFGVRVRILWDAETGRLLCIPLGRSR
jgi:ABC-type cobalamin/Fe3+-siderophores transport system ATPase subunit